MAPPDRRIGRVEPSRNNVHVAVIVATTGLDAAGRHFNVAAQELVGKHGVLQWRRSRRAGPRSNRNSSCWGKQPVAMGGGELRVAETPCKHADLHNRNSRCSGPENSRTRLAKEEVAKQPVAMGWGELVAETPCKHADLHNRNNRCSGPENSRTRLAKEEVVVWGWQAPHGGTRVGHRDRSSKPARDCHSSNHVRLAAAQEVVARSSAPAREVPDAPWEETWGQLST